MNPPAPEAHAKSLAVIAPVCHQFFGSGFGTPWTSLGNLDQDHGLLDQRDFRLLRAVQQDR
jgi:hypothetical protein